MLMQPRPSADTSRPRPRVRDSIDRAPFVIESTEGRSVAYPCQSISSLGGVASAIERPRDDDPRDGPARLARRHERDLEPLDRLLPRLQPPRFSLAAVGRLLVDV